MDLLLEKYDPQKHDKRKLSELIYESDEEINALVYGDDPLEVISKMIGVDDSYFTSEHMRCVIANGELAGVLVRFPVEKYDEVDKNAGRGFANAMGFLSFFKKMPLFMKMGRMLGGEMDETALYIHTICIEEKFRGAGIASQVVRKLESENDKMYLYVNKDNEKAIRFYQKNGFNKKHLGKMKHKGKIYGEYLMEKTAAAK